MTFNYFVQHKFFKEMMLKRIRTDAIKKAIDEEDGSFFTDMLTSIINYFGDEKPEERDAMQYETSFILAGENKLARCKFTGTLPPRCPECSSILVSVTDAVRYFTVEYTLEDEFMLCAWDGETHLNYGAITADEPELYVDKLRAILEN